MFYRAVSITSPVGRTVTVPLGFTVLEVGTAAETPVWVTLTLFALNHVIEMHAAPHADERPATAPVFVKS